jgi:uncharacterized glyoxalase superfamily protein PhnB
MLGGNPYIAFKGNCRQAIEFYKTALGADVLFTQTVGESPMANMGPAANIVHCTGVNISLAIGIERSRTGQATLWQSC